MGKHEVHLCLFQAYLEFDLPDLSRQKQMILFLRKYFQFLPPEELQWQNELPLNKKLFCGLPQQKYTAASMELN